MSTRLIDITGIEQGTIDNYGNQSASNRVRSAERYAINFGQQIKISVQSGSSIKTNIMLYTDSTTNRALWDSGWFDNGQGIDISNYPTAKYFRVVLRKSDGTNITPSDIVSCNAEIVESDTGIKDIDNWIKNSAAFTQFDNVYSNGLNTLTFTGGGGCERIYFPVTVTQGSSLTFSLKFCSPTGFTCQYGDNKDYIAITKNEPSGSGQITDYQILSRTAVSSEASSVLRDYSITITANYSGLAYLVIDMGYITDNVQIELLYSDISYETEYIWHIKNGELTCDNFYTTANSEITKPYPKSYFKVEPDGNITSELLPDLQHKPTRPLAQWYIDSTLGVTCWGQPEPIPRGALTFATNLTSCRIPTTVKYIGKNVFRYTKLQEVTIASDCVYFSTSFPENCQIYFYPS